MTTESFNLKAAVQPKRNEEQLDHTEKKEKRDLFTEFKKEEMDTAD